MADSKTKEFNKEEAIEQITELSEKLLFNLFRPALTTKENRYFAELFYPLQWAVPLPVPSVEFSTKEEAEKALKLLSDSLAYVFTLLKHFDKLCQSVLTAQKKASTDAQKKIPL